MEYYHPKYDTLRLLSDAGRFLVADRLKRFLRDYEVREWPVNCFALLRRIQESGKINLALQTCSGLSGGFDAVTEYLPSIGCYLVITKPPPENWAQRSSARRCNFTLAHELGHIFLGHMEIPREAKSEQHLERDDAEADEFASRLLMPEKLILTGRFASRAEMAAAFLVSEQACWHRLNNLHRLDRLACPPPECPECGSRLISPWARFCRHCGAFLRPGEDRALPEEAQEDAPVIRFPLPRECPFCGTDILPLPGGECTVCGVPWNNPCLAEYDQPRHPNPAAALFCEICGAETTCASMFRNPI